MRSASMKPILNSAAATAPESQISPTDNATAASVAYKLFNVASFIKCRQSNARAAGS